MGKDYILMSANNRCDMQLPHNHCDLWTTTRSDPSTQKDNPKHDNSFSVFVLCCPIKIMFVLCCPIKISFHFNLCVSGSYFLECCPIKIMFVLCCPIKIMFVLCCPIKISIHFNLVCVWILLFGMLAVSINPVCVWTLLSGMLAVSLLSY